MKPILVLGGWLVVIFTLSLGIQKVQGQPTQNLIADVAWSEDGASLLVATWHTLYVYNANDWEASPSRIPLDTTIVRAMDVQHDQVVVGSDTDISVWNFQTGKRIFYTNQARGYVSFRGENQIVSAAFGVALTDLGTGELVSSFGSYYWPVSAFAISPDSELVAATNSGEGGSLWELETGESTAPLPDATDLTFSLDGSALAYSSIYDAITLWDVETNEVRWQVEPYQGSGVISLDFHPDGTSIAVVYRDGNLLLCDSQNGERLDSVQQYSPIGNNSILNYGLVFSPDGEMLAAGGSDGMVRIWNVDDGQLPDEPLVTLSIDLSDMG